VRKRVQSTASIDGARLVRVRGREATLFCTHETWARSLAEAHGAKIIARTRPNRATPKLVPLAIPFSAAAAVGVWFFANPVVRIDDGFDESVQIWVDGRRAVIATPSGPGASTTQLRLSHGEHAMAWSPVGASAPVETTKVQIEAGHDPLYVPARVNCYYRELEVYGKTSQQPTSTPLDVSDFYDFRSVDNWFAPNPSSVTLEKGESATKIAIQRSKWCLYFHSPPCPDGERERYWRCMSAHWTDAEGGWRCARDSSLACGFEPPKDPSGGAWSSQ
jgi:hypothetical protein